ncbi:hypothetical protein KIH41_17400 [Litoribacter ruber]|uniref:RHS repeat domain-containing protein n=1 Tax=Litoribacter ruber TaxID=702568 RepID=UPI001BDA4686|nr:RHS repeat-associated core domain-containing protein [Litoribacter ruber]MBT0813068.1 hypothetical protein [Litoribacter ruber]
MNTYLPGLEQDPMQAMVYHYDQLHRIVEARSLTEYSSGSGFASRSTNPSAYDVDYSYDANGNLLTLNRRNDQASVQDDFEYSYYENSNKLRNIDGSTGSNYTYDEIGNLISDDSEGITGIEWNPYGKIRSVNKSDGTKLEFRYDAAGQRIEKKVGESVQRYVRDASGNPMAIYEIDSLTEQSIYGSSRLGIQVASSQQGYRSLGGKRYELSNHLGNVLAVVTDNIHMYQDSTWAQVSSLTDYYPFGLAMEGRLQQDTLIYRYGFNGQERIDEISGPHKHFTAEFWEYSPLIGRRWNLDPIDQLSISNYAVLKNNPLSFIDPKGNVPSTHTDEDGRVIAVEDDGDLGVYKHEGKGNDALSNFLANYSSSNISAGGKKMGETYTPFGFADFDAYERDGSVIAAAGAVIDFNSNWATEQVLGVLNQNPNMGEYALKARGGKEWDLKAYSPNGNSYFGSKLFDKYASARDAGNFTAGAIAQKSKIPNFIFDYGFGVYNQSGNNELKSGLMIASDLMTFPMGLGVMIYRAKFGEDKFTQMGIEAGKKYFRKQ